jgi:hypothetical protein
MRTATLIVTLAALVAATTAAAAAASPPRFAGCASFVSPTALGKVRPAAITLACGDGNFYVTNIRWSSWGARSAAGAGVGHLNDCTPYCAAGKFHSYRVSIHLDERRLCGPRRTAELTRAAWRFADSKPRGAASAGSERFRCA